MKQYLFSKLETETKNNKKDEGNEMKPMNNQIIQSQQENFLPFENSIE